MPPQAIIDLVEAFSRNETSYRSPQYKEAEVRCEFIDPFFECLGWDVQNRRKYAENYKDVVHEPSPKWSMRKQLSSFQNSPSNSEFAPRS